MRIPLSSPDITEPEIAEVVAVLRSPQLSLGPRLAEFESAFVRHTGREHAIAVSSGTAGLHLAVRALGLGPGDEVVVPSFTFIAAANCLRYEGVTPVFADIEAASLNLDPAAVEAALTPRTRALMVVHTFGRPANLPALLALAARHGLFVIEDACEALGAVLDRRPVGSFGHVAVFAFYPNKQITTGEGGMVVTGDATLAARIRALRNQGRIPSDDWFQHTELGYNYRLSEIACALGIGQMRRLPAILARREHLARFYNQQLAGTQGLHLPALDLPHARLSWFVYVVRLTDGSSARRDWIIARMAEAGIACGRYFAPIHLQPAYAPWRERSAPLPVTEAVASGTIALPFFNRLEEGEIVEVAGQLRSLLTSPSAAG